MALESATYISDLVVSNPSASDLTSQGDDHLRLIKSTLQATFPNITGPVTYTQAQLNAALLTSGGTMTGNLILNANPTVALGAATKSYVDTTTVPSARKVLTDEITLTGGSDLTADRTLSIKAGGVGTTQLGSGVVTQTNMASGSVGSSQLAANAVTTTAIADASVTTSKLVDGSVTPAKFSIAPITSGTSQSTSSGSSIDFTGIPSGATRVTVVFSGVSLNTNLYHIGIQLNDGTLRTSGYTSGSYLSGIGGLLSTQGFIVRTENATFGYSGHMVLEKVTGNSWVAAHVLAADSSGYVATGGGKMSLTNALQSIRLQVLDSSGNVSGAATFDAGTVNLIWE